MLKEIHHHTPATRNVKFFKQKRMDTQWKLRPPKRKNKEYGQISECGQRCGQGRILYSFLKK